MLTVCVCVSSAYLFVNRISLTEKALFDNIFWADAVGTRKIHVTFGNDPDDNQDPG